MGLFGFLKGKNAVDKPMAPPGDLPALTDLPPIEGSALPQNLPDMPSMTPTAVVGKDSLTLQMPSLDFSLPPKDEEIVQATKPQLDPLPSFPAPADAPLQGTLQSLETPHDSYVDLSEDLNKLFFADNDWHEPDMDNYNPYPEPEIEPPMPADFGYSEIPTREVTEASDLPSFEEKPRVVSDVPVDVFVRGKDYVRVYSEMDKINYLLDKQEPKILILFEEVIGKEEELLKGSKNAMEYVYKRLLVIDKRIFG